MTFGSNDIVAIDKAVLDMTAQPASHRDEIPTPLEVHVREGHPFQ